MSIHLDENCLDLWLNDFDAFRVDFLRVCHPICMALGYELDFDQRQLEIAHIGWRNSHSVWQGHLVTNSPQLSHIKLVALLLYHLCKVDWVRNLFVYSGDYHEFNGSPEDRVESAKDLNAGREAFLALNFAIHIINWYETKRIDKIDPFVYRMTFDLEFDLMHYLISSECSEIAVFLVLKALYARD